jgi:acetyl esterase/lipase
MISPRLRSQLVQILRSRLAPIGMAVVLGCGCLGAVESALAAAAPGAAAATPSATATPNYVAQLSANLEPARRVVYKKIGDRELHLELFEPPGWKAGDRRACFVAFHGGGWTGGAPRVNRRNASGPQGGDATGK